VGLCLGGLDPSGGAGLLRDAMTLAALGVHPMAVCAADTVQNGQACTAIRPPLDPAPALEALAPHLAAPQRWGVKLGLMRLDPGALAALAARIQELAPLARIWDPVRAPTAGVGLHSAAELRAMAGTILGPGGWVVSPNLPEAAALGGSDGPAGLARPWLDLGAAAVWLKGGHGAGDALEDFWITREAALGLGRLPRLPGERRGTGCTLASAWLAYRLTGRDDLEAAREAAQFLRRSWDPPLAPGGFGRPCFAPHPRPGAP
jgi:hydroxymethylpyrimidine/phosphomethylpyrimidine kinase